jgi:gluconate kinase
MGNGVYFIGGPSITGKSTAAKRLASQFGIDYFELDQICFFLANLRLDAKAMYNMTVNICSTFVEQLIKNNAVCIVEGSWIAPEKAKALIEQYSDKFFAIYCAYPHADISKRLEFAKKSDHWLFKRSIRNPIEWHVPGAKRDPVAWLNLEIQNSKWYRHECLRLNIPFIDFSDIDTGFARLQENFSEWWSCEGVESTATAAIKTRIIAEDSYIFVPKNQIYLPAPTRWRDLLRLVITHLPNAFRSRIIRLKEVFDRSSRNNISS